MTQDTEALREALAAHYPTGEWMQPCGNHVLCCSCGENLWGVDRDACKAAWRTHVIEALATPDTIGSHFGNGGGLDPAEGGVGPVHSYYYETWHEGRVISYGFEPANNRRKTLTGSSTETPLYAHPPHPAPVDPVAGGEALREALRRAALRLEICAGYIDSSFGLSGTRRAERAMKAKHFALEALAALKGPAA